METREIEAFIEKLRAPWQRDLCTELLQVIARAAPELQGSIKWRNPYFSRGGAVLKWFVAKEWINVYFYDGVGIPDPAGLFIETDNEAMRTVRLREGDRLDTRAFAALVKRASALKKA